MQAAGHTDRSVVSQRPLGQTGRHGRSHGQRHAHRHWYNAPTQHTGGQHATHL
ncbi:hypothetical protein BC831DRAFT_475731 [Entophlyctis helioformis]|nr:hypothetical protein BC831DRAFT_475731 [Entophlyctis helioformis]